MDCQCLFFVSTFWSCPRLPCGKNKRVAKVACIDRKSYSQWRYCRPFPIVSQQSNENDNNKDSVPAEEDIDPAAELHPSWNIYEEPGNKCLICLGRGKVKCLYCFGKGSVRIGPDEEDSIPCNQCNGEMYTVCERCEGTGVRPSVIYDFETHQWVPGPTNADILQRIKEKWGKKET